MTVAYELCKIVDFLHGEYKAKLIFILWLVDEGRKRVLLIAAAILAARKRA
jgi:hypothetical protein